ncbi:MAG: protein-L-isoaspartate(D-aspartate) O-methyltransferase [Rhodospirillaceae bacterium]|nr:protein-L-isoaspartate(D-aspartate) O-methyltransferase [Rhodospirillaceae bacterium]MBT7488112.1 protein-L-isoaspartate(D-aspartate) O-methyltransferase [Rhodospirillales bacterium]MBT4700474.1 protein-L-isoaspartate(D-aspartate) O-methyltransferase [Rhodospirillaceae bacterium]MBT5036549.1 protein-L-isoaspartate(D-aspartate) O-methyltransferase [Rhodospirillaceae bacterium]MBT6220040.1 protein-L-isoaspartate(D-aspartate) O-methyltransferase [Rhodospirillaceae bacterium]
MLQEIEVDAFETRKRTGRRKFSDKVMSAMANVPRHKFMAPDEARFAYINRPQSIGHGQTISQPYIVALMTDLLDLTPKDRVLEIGTGSGYQTAVLSSIVAEVYSVETIAPLADAAGLRLKNLGYENAHVRHADGYEGWPEEALFDAIIVTAAPPRFPEALTQQLANGGRMIVPVGRPHEPQTLYLCSKNDDGELTKKKVLPVAFVPMVESLK